MDSFFDILACGECEKEVVMIRMTGAGFEPGTPHPANHAVSDNRQILHVIQTCKFFADGSSGHARCRELSTGTVHGLILMLRARKDAAVE
jgi:hypothetical protein